MVAPKNAQEAHEAIRPADAGGGKFKQPEDTGLDGVHLKLYDLIYRRTLASVMTPSQTQTTTYTITGTHDYVKGSSCTEVKFKTSDSVVLFDGYLAAHGSQSKKKRDSFPKLLKNQQVWLSKYPSVNSNDMQPIDEEDMELARNETVADKFSGFLSSGLSGIAHVTKPPSRFTEAGFIQELEAVGVGRPSTYAKIFETLREREYVFIDKKTIVPTLKGFYTCI
jgi:DNA topoisomerase-1